jgi:hypothetical protein
MARRIVQPNFLLGADRRNEETAMAEYATQVQF